MNDLALSFTCRWTLHLGPLEGKIKYLCCLLELDSISFLGWPRVKSQWWGFTWIKMGGERLSSRCTGGANWGLFLPCISWIALLTEIAFVTLFSPKIMSYYQHMLYVLWCLQKRDQESLRENEIRGKRGSRGRLFPLLVIDSLKHLLKQDFLSRYCSPQRGKKARCNWNTSCCEHCRRWGVFSLARVSRSRGGWKRLHFKVLIGT